MMIWKRSKEKKLKKLIADHEKTLKTLEEVQREKESLIDEAKNEKNVLKRLLKHSTIRHLEDIELELELKIKC